MSMSGHRRSRPSSDDASPSGRSPCHHTSMPTTTKHKDTHVPTGHHRRRFKRSSCSSSMDSPPPASRRPSWVILNLAGARRDAFPGDHRTTSSASALTSNGDKVSVSFELVAPPGTSVLCLEGPQGPGPMSSTRPDVIAAHRDVVLLKMSRRFGGGGDPVDYFVYQGSTGGAGDPSSLSLLPLHYHEELGFGGKPRQCLLSKDSTGIMSCCRDDREGSSSSFVVAKLSMTREAADSPPAINVHVFRSGSGEWEAFKNLHVRGANGGRDLNFWHTDAVVPYGRGRFLIWVDYYRGMIVADMLSLPESEKKNQPPPPPRLRYVPLPVDTVGDPDDYAYHGRGCPANSRSVCGTRYGIKFVSVDSKHCSNWGVGHANVLTWNHTFRITTWSLREDDYYTWRKDVTMYEEEFWDDALGSEKRFPRVTREYPVVSMENPDAVCFRLKKNLYRYDEPTWMVEVDLRKKILLGATAYSEEGSLYGYEHTINSARIYSSDISISTELPRYLDSTGQTYKRRRS